MKTVLLGDVCIQITDGTHSTVKDDTDGKYFLLSAKNIKDNVIISKNERRINRETLVGLRKRTKTSKDDVLLTSVGTIGETAIIQDESPTYEFQRSVAILKPDPSQIIPKYLLYFLRSKKLELNSLATGAVQKCLFIGQIKNIGLDLLDMEDQEKIAEILGRIDEKIELNRRMNNTLEQIGQALFNYYFIANPKSKNWANARLLDFTDVITGKGSTKSVLAEGGRYPLYGAGGIMGTSDKFLIDEAVIITGRVGTLGRIQAVTGKSWFSDNVLIMKPKVGYFGFVYYLVRSFDFISMNRGSSQPLVTQTDLKNCLVIAPDDPSLSEFDMQFQSAFNLIQENEKASIALGKLRDSLLPRLISGKIKV